MPRNGCLPNTGALTVCISEYRCTTGKYVMSGMLSFVNWFLILSQISPPFFLSALVSCHLHICVCRLGRVSRRRGKCQEFLVMRVTFRTNYQINFELCCITYIWFDSSWMHVGKKKVKPDANYSCKMSLPWSALRHNGFSHWKFFPPITSICQSIEHPIQW